MTTSTTAESMTPTVSSTESRQSQMQECLELLDFSDAELDAFFSIPDAQIEEDSVPAAYIRSRLPSLRLDPTINPDYQILLLDESNHHAPLFRSGMHTLTWSTQCLTLLPLSTVDSFTRTCSVPNARVIEAIKPFITWLYTNDEQRLYNELSAGLAAGSETYVLSFCQLVRLAGCVNYKLAGIVRTIYSHDDADLCQNDDRQEHGNNHHTNNVQT